ncbi:MAG TPA: hypothetical protein DCZ75_07605 [Geobacter sp.]|nr:hypothetical protein [Geobacter sp.]
MIPVARRVLRTVQLVCYALLPPTGGSADPAGAGEPRNCEPREIRGGMGRFLDSRGELRLFFDGCYATAAPFILFRLKREGFSRCSVRASERGLLVQGVR